MLFYEGNIEYYRILRKLRGKNQPQCLDFNTSISFVSGSFKSLVMSIYIYFYVVARIVHAKALRSSLALHKLKFHQALSLSKLPVTSERCKSSDHHQDAGNDHGCFFLGHGTVHHEEEESSSGSA